ncbi:AzlC family ABC transporter permease [Pseudoxanthobacter sp.]|uniref:AzlC family ABC transporter permease n=1 Tax=Pseudoxanthobacter sp. TaxID=1925742 RepID=UPI002FE1DA6C
MSASSPVPPPGSPAPPSGLPEAAGFRAEFTAGAAAMLPVVVAMVPFGFILGALAATKGISTLEMALMSGFVFAGGAQFVALDLWARPVPWLAVGFAAFIVNLRHVLMGASLARSMGAFPKAVRPLALLFLADEIWAYAEQRAAHARLTPAYFAGLAGTLYCAWQVTTVAGTLMGRALGDPERYGFDFAFAAIFIGLLAGFRDRAGFLPAVAAAAPVAVAVSAVASGPAAIAAGAVAGIAAAAFSGPKHRGEQA